MQNQIQMYRHNVVSLWGKKYFSGRPSLLFEPLSEASRLPFLQLLCVLMDLHIKYTKSESVVKGVHL